MTVKELIKQLERLEKKHPRRQVYVDLETRNKNMDGDWSHRMVVSAALENIYKGDDDGGLAINSKGEDIPMDVVTLDIN